MKLTLLREEIRRYHSDKIPLPPERKPVQRHVNMGPIGPGTRDYSNWQQPYISYYCESATNPTEHHKCVANWCECACHETENWGGV